MVMQLKVSGDPRRPEAVCQYQRVKQSEDQADLYLLISLACGMLALWAKWRTWCFGAAGSLLMALANTSGNRMDLKQLVSATTLVLFAFMATYLQPPVRDAAAAAAAAAVGGSGGVAAAGAAGGGS